MKAMFKKYKIVWIGLCIPYLFAMFMFTYRIDYRLTTPGDLEAIDSFILFDETYEQSNPFYSVYIMSIDKPTFFQFIMVYFDDYITTTMIPQSRSNVSTISNFRSGQVARNSAIDASIIASYEALGLEVEYEIEELVYLIYDYMDNDQVEIGDKIISVNGNTNISQGINDTECGSEATFELEKEDGSVVSAPITKQVDENCRFGISTTTYYRITTLEIPYEVRQNLVGGPSGGLMQTLYIYNALSPYDLTQGLKIAGTGTIRIDGTVGPVSGVRQKVFTAHMEAVDLFFVPSGSGAKQAREALEVIDQPTLEIVEVSTFLDAINYLINRHGVSQDE